MKTILAVLRRMFIYEPPAPPPAKAVKLCPFDGCRVQLQRDYPFCNYHIDFLPLWLYREIRCTRRDYGTASPEYAEVLRWAKNVIRRKLLPPG